MTGEEGGGQERERAREKCWQVITKDVTSLLSCSID